MSQYLQEIVSVKYWSENTIWICEFPNWLIFTYEDINLCMIILSYVYLVSIIHRIKIKQELVNI